MVQDHRHRRAHVLLQPGIHRRLTLEQTQFVLAHEALHCALSHFARRQHRIKHRWDVACDLAINPILIEEGMTAVPGALYNIGYEGMMAEEIYPAGQGKRRTAAARRAPLWQGLAKRGSSDSGERRMRRQPDDSRR